MKGMTDMGLQLLGEVLQPSLYIGVIFACFHSFGIEHDSMQLLML